MVLGGSGGVMISPSLGGTITVVQLHLGRVEVFVTGYGGAFTSAKKGLSSK